MLYVVAEAVSSARSSGTLVVRGMVEESNLRIVRMCRERVVLSCGIIEKMYKMSDGVSSDLKQADVVMGR